MCDQITQRKIAGSQQDIQFSDATDLKLAADFCRRMAESAQADQLRCSATAADLLGFICETKQPAQTPSAAHEVTISGILAS